MLESDFPPVTLNSFPVERSSNRIETLALLLRKSSLCLVCTRTVKLVLTLLYGTHCSAEAPVPTGFMALGNSWRTVCHGIVSGVGPGRGLGCRP